MAFPKGKKRPEMIGNKYGVGNHNAGRPPTISDEDLEILGQEMIEQIEKHDDWLFIQEFAIYKKMSPKVVWECADRKAFSDYYDRAKAILGCRLSKRGGKKGPDGQDIINAGIAQRFLNSYFTDVKKTEIDIIEAKKNKDKENELTNFAEKLRAFLASTNNTVD